MPEEMARNVGPAGVDLAYERFGDPAAPPVLLVAGSGQMIGWPEELCAELVDRGLFVVRFDNRDSGRSTHILDGPEPDLMAAIGGDVSSAAYTLSDMAGDSVGLLDALGLGSAHLVGLSQGGMVAQTIALEHPDRVRSLTSMMSTTGDLAVGRADLSSLSGLGPQPADRAGYVDWQVRAMRGVHGPGFPFDAERAAQRAALAYDRDPDTVGGLRQKVAVLASGDRTERLRGLRRPTLVIHGTADIMIGLSGGQATAAAIPGAELVTVEGLGHSLPRPLWPVFADHIAQHVHRAEQGRKA